MKILQYADYQSVPSKQIPGKGGVNMRRFFILVIAGFCSLTLLMTPVAASEEGQVNMVVGPVDESPTANSSGVHESFNLNANSPDVQLQDGITSETGSFIIDYEQPANFSVSPDWNLDKTNTSFLSGLFSIQSDEPGENYMVRQSVPSSYNPVVTDANNLGFHEGLRLIQFTVFREYEQ